ncbi:glycoside hydrolase family 57 protein [Acidilobus sp.]|jgi:alpha-amylase|uniref:glycoside hydrolase family 57 protein n=1 Tax=Acidilobus sp. TaxID=1872109 RepID=UPI003D0063E5
MTSRIALFFELHQPLRLKRLSFYSPSNLPTSFSDAIDAAGNSEILSRVVSRTYLAATKILYEASQKVRDFKMTMSISGVLLEQLKKEHEEVIDLLRKLVDKGLLELAAQTYYHSLAWFVDKAEFEDQVKAQVELVRETFGVNPSIAENTEFIYNNDIGCEFQRLGFKGVITEGVDWLLGWRSPNYVYKNPLCDVKLLLRNYRLSDDIGFRFSDRRWSEYPLTADKYASWVASTPGDLVVIALDYETFGEHHWPESGIHEFLRWLPVELSKRGVTFLRASEALNLEPRDYLDVPPWSTISWADERDLSAWLGNGMQRKAFDVLRRYYYFARALGGSYLRSWRLLSVSDNLYYMATKPGGEGEVHSYFSYLGDPYDSFLTYSYALELLGLMIRNGLKENPCTAIKVRLPDDLCLRFYNSSGAEVAKACSIPEMASALKTLPEEVVSKAVSMSYLDRWSQEVFGLNLDTALGLIRRC